MTSRERIRATLRHEKPDMLPIDFGAHRSSGISAIAYNNLKKHLGLDPKTTMLYDVMQQLAIPEPEILDRFSADVVQLIQLYPAFGTRVDKWKAGTLQDGSPCLLPENLNPVSTPQGDEIRAADGTPIAKRPKNGLYYDNANYFLRDVEDIDDLKKLWGKPSISEEELDFLEKQAIWNHEHSQRATLAHVGCAVYEEGQQEFGFENFYYLLAAEPELIHCWAEHLVEGYMEILDKVLGRIGKYLDIVMFGGDDLGSQKAQQISTQMYREMIKPYHSMMYHFVRKKSPNEGAQQPACAERAQAQGKPDAQGAV